MERDAQTRDVVTEPPDNTEDPWLYRMLVGGLLIVVLLAVLGVLVLTGKGQAGNDVLMAVVTIAAAAVGYLGGLLTPRASK